MRPSIRVTLTSGGGSLYKAAPPPNVGPVGASRVGGDPDLPPIFSWPRWGNLPLSFVAQINLAEITALEPEQALPSDGMLYIFYEASLEALISDDPDDGCRVVYYSGELSQLAPTLAPPDLPDYGRLLPCRMTFRREWTVPMMDSVEFDQFGLEDLGDDWESYRLCYVDWTEERDRDLPQSPLNTVPQHRLLGCPDIMYNDGRWGCLEDETEEVTQEEWGDKAFRQSWLRKRAPEALKWRLLFQIDSDDSAELNWGDAGLIYFFIHEDDLRARRFTRVRANYEGH